MSKLFNAQNLSGFKWKDFLIYFTGVTGSYVIYRYDTTSGRYAKARSASELLKAENIYVSYSYLGGIHISNYSMTKEVIGNETNFHFELGKVYSQLYGGTDNPFWDIPNAAFLRQIKGDYSIGISPIRSFIITLVGSNPSSVFSTKFTTFSDVSGRNCTIDFGSITDSQELGESFIAIRDLNQNAILWQGFGALTNAITDGSYSNPIPIYQAYRSGTYVKQSTPVYRFTINPQPSDAVVYINGERTYSVQIPYGTEIQWSVEKEGYITQSGTYTVMGDYVLNVQLVAQSPEPETQDSDVSSNTETRSTDRAMVRATQDSEVSDITEYDFYQTYGLIAAFFGFMKSGNILYRRIYLVSSSSGAFNIAEEANYAFGAMIEGSSDADMDYHGGMEDRSFTYYQLDSDI